MTSPCDCNVAKLHAWDLAVEDKEVCQKENALCSWIQAPQPYHVPIDESCFLSVVAKQEQRQDFFQDEENMDWQD